MPHTDYTDTFPMWHGDTIYFTSDRGPEHRLNLYSYDAGSKQVEQLTKFEDFDVMWPSLGPDANYFREWRIRCTPSISKASKPKKLTIYVNGDRDQAMKHWASASKQYYRFRYCAGWEAGRVCGAGRGVHGSGEGGEHSQSDALSGSPRAERGMVAERPMDRLHFRSHG